MALVDTLAEALAKDALDLSEKLDDERLPDEVGKAIGASSPSFEEVYLTAIRLMRAERRARQVLAAKGWSPEE
ncbi:MAG: hypothetical protein AAFR35_06240 [Pseudomonadota bacterium]